MAVVIPPEGKLSETARRLLELADSVHDVRTIGNGTMFEVPDEVAEKLYGKQAQTPAPAAPVRRRGRAPRVNTTEKEGQS